LSPRGRTTQTPAASVLHHTNPTQGSLSDSLPLLRRMNQASKKPVHGTEISREYDGGWSGGDLLRVAAEHRLGQLLPLLRIRHSDDCVRLHVAARGRELLWKSIQSTNNARLPQTIA